MAKAKMKARTKNVEELAPLYRDLICEVSDCREREGDYFYRCTFFKGMKAEITYWIDSELLVIL